MVVINHYIMHDPPRYLTLFPLNNAVIQNLIFETFNIDIPTQGICFLILEIFCSTKGVSKED